MKVVAEFCQALLITYLGFYFVGIFFAFIK